MLAQSALRGACPNGKFRSEHLNEQWFETLHQAHNATAIWRQDYDEVRPHSSIERLPPARFADPLQPPRRSINVGTPDFINSVGTPVGGRLRGQELAAEGSGAAARGEGGRQALAAAHLHAAHKKSSIGQACGRPLRVPGLRVGPTGAPSA